MSKVIILCVTFICSMSISGMSQSLTDVRIAYPDDTILINLNDKEVQRIERKTRSYIEEFACDQIWFDNTKSYSLDSAQTYSDMQFIQAINKIPNDLLQDMVMFCGMNITRKGWHLGFDFSYGASPIVNETFNTIYLDNSENSWTQSDGMGIIAGLNAYYHFHNNFGIKSGLNYSSFESTYSLYGEYTDPDISIDINENEYYKVINSAFDSLLEIRNLTIPIVLNYTSAKPGNIGFYIEAGVLLSAKLASNYKSSGDYQVYGFYPDSHPLLQFRYSGQPQFFQDENINRTGKLPIKYFNFSAYTSLGMNIALGYYSSVKIGPELIYGLGDLDKEQSFLNIFGNSVNKMPTLLKKFSLKLSYIYKL